MSEDPGAPALIELDQARVLRGGRPALDRVSLCLPQGRHTAILGPNGCGKSTFIQLITRQLYPMAHLDGRPAVKILGQWRWNVATLRSRLGIVTGAMHDDLLGLPGLGVLDVVLGAFEARLAPPDGDPPPAAWLEQARAALERVDADHLADREYATLSTGEARRVLLARALANAPMALLLDEPAAGLDVVARARLLRILRRLAREGVTLVLVTHHAEELIPEIGHVVLLQGGRVLADGPRHEVLVPELLSRAYGAPLRFEDGASPRFVPEEAVDA
ncbi:ABC transporter ATP-binding protein [Luteimonas wenzhouensis]|uniref:ATP-binding cassette domain-containing protein n=1 Tax=Luteimonas wenzhouensis TaxID=2599615 RepID=A0A5C5TUT4_9GAMM|nr:ATP-binding cassette domain-containing protein [Luteimonas wenzhouensis]TWT16960.1 ATP-binding cassette domain-containing protein [Luteimonas wenzhouensis]